METFGILILFWFGLLLGGKRLVMVLRQRRYLTPAHSLKDIKIAAYYSRLATGQFESLVMQGIRARGYALLGNPWLGRTRHQGYAWTGGKKTVVTHHLRAPLTEGDLKDIAQRLYLSNADQVLVFSPLGAPSKKASKRVEVLTGKTLLGWFAALDTVAPPVSKRFAVCKCVCGAPMEERVNQVGQPLQVCSMYPGCKVVLRGTESGAGAAANRAHSRALST